VCNTEAVTDTRERILDVALELLGRDPDAGMGEIASAVGVVRRTVYGHFPSRADLVRTLTRRAVSEVAAVLAEADASGAAADAVWADFIARLWPLMRRYRVLLVLRRGEYGDEIHSLLVPVEQTLADLVGRGQDSGVFGRHLPAEVLSQVAFSAVFAIADTALVDGSISVRSATITSLLLLGVPEARAEEAMAGRP
jgi:AcrR family transcriptional regulator